MSTEKSRPQTRREEQAAETRRRIVDAARDLFGTRGYAGTTIDAVATTAGVSLQTIYNSVGGKPTLLKAAYDVSLVGDHEPVPMVERPRFRAMLAASTGRQALTHYAALSREICERIGPLVAMALAQAAAGDPDLQEFATTIERERAMGTAATARFVADKFGLRDGLTTTHAADVLWTLTSHDVLRRLTEARRWTLSRYEQWLAQTMADALLGPDL